MTRPTRKAAAKAPKYTADSPSASEDEGGRAASSSKPSTRRRKRTADEEDDAWSHGELRWRAQRLQTAPTHPARPRADDDSDAPAAKKARKASSASKSKGKGKGRGRAGKLQSFQAMPLDILAESPSSFRFLNLRCRLTFDTSRRSRSPPRPDHAPAHVAR